MAILTFGFGNIDTVFTPHSSCKGQWSYKLNLMAAQLHHVRQNRFGINCLFLLLKPPRSQ